MPIDKLLINNDAAKIKAALLKKNYHKKTVDRRSAYITFGHSHERLELFNDNLNNIKLEFSSIEIRSFALRFIHRAGPHLPRTNNKAKKEIVRSAQPIIGSFTKAIVNSNSSKQDWYARCNEKMRDEYRLRISSVEKHKPKKLKELKIKIAPVAKANKSSSKNAIHEFVQTLQNILGKGAGQGR